MERYCQFGKPDPADSNCKTGKEFILFVKTGEYVPKGTIWEHTIGDSIFFRFLNNKATISYSINGNRFHG